MTDNRTPASFEERRRIADRIFRGAFVFNAALTAFWAVVYFTEGNAVFFSDYTFNLQSIDRVLMVVSILS